MQFIDAFAGEEETDRFRAEKEAASSAGILSGGAEIRLQFHRRSVDRKGRTEGKNMVNCNQKEAAQQVHETREGPFNF